MQDFQDTFETHLLKNGLWNRCFHERCFCEIVKNTFFTEHLLAALSALKDLHGDKVSRDIV